MKKTRAQNPYNLNCTQGQQQSHFIPPFPLVQSYIALCPS